MANNTLILASSMATASSYSILSTTSHSFFIKLNTKNYLAWKTQFIPILNYQNLHGILNGSNPQPSPTKASSSDPNMEEPNPEYEIWHKKDQMLLSWLFSSITEEIFPYVIGLTSSREVWMALENSFGSISQNCLLQLHIELQELKKNDISISQFLQKTKALSDELRAAGKPLSPADFNAIIYRNIGLEFHSIIIALNLRAELVSFCKLHGQLVAHEILIKGSLEPQANMVIKTSEPLLPTLSIQSPRPPGTSYHSTQSRNNNGQC
jgi:hypothetical protein